MKTGDSRSLAPSTGERPLRSQVVHIRSRLRTEVTGCRGDVYLLLEFNESTEGKESRQNKLTNYLEIGMSE
jgi:hypothetical protein